MILADAMDKKKKKNHDGSSVKFCCCWYLHPSVGGESEPIQLLPEEFNHVGTLGLAVHQDVQPQGLLLRTNQRDERTKRVETACFGWSFQLRYVWRANQWDCDCE